MHETATAICNGEACHPQNYEELSKVCTLSRETKIKLGYRSINHYRPSQTPVIEYQCKKLFFPASSRRQNNAANPTTKPALLIGRLTTCDHEWSNQKPAFVFAAEVGIAGLGSRKQGLHRLIDSLDHCKFSFFQSGKFQFSCLLSSLA